MEYEEREQFEITDDSTAEWALKKVLEAKRERERLLELVEKERELLDEKEKKINIRYDSSTAYLLSQLYAYFDTVAKKKTKTQESYQLLSGKLIRRFPKQKLVPDKAALLEWCKDNAPEYIKHTEEAMWGEIKSKFEIMGDVVVNSSTGEVVSCVTVAEEPSTFDVKGD
jgi:hypothetical protein